MSETERAVARANMLLERYGIVSREAALAEVDPRRVRTAVQGAERDGGRRPRAARLLRRGACRGPSSDTSARSTGYVRRGAARRCGGNRRPGDELRLVAAMDPANPFGALLTVAGRRGGGRAPAPPRARRVGGAHRRKLPKLYVGPQGPASHHLPRRPTTRTPEALERAIRTLHKSAARRAARADGGGEDRRHTRSTSRPTTH